MSQLELLGEGAIPFLSEVVRESSLEDLPLRVEVLALIDCDASAKLLRDMLEKEKEKERHRIFLDPLRPYHKIRATILLSLADVGDMSALTEVWDELKRSNALCAA